MEGAQMTMGRIKGVIKRNVGDQVYYYGTIQSDQIKNVTYVPVIEESTKSYLLENAEGGFQRPGSRSRMRAFKRYLADNPNRIVPPVLLSSRDMWRFEPTSDDEKFGDIVIDAPATIIDGQHRIGGYVALFEEEEQTRPIDFILLEGLDTEEETREFTTVNNTQKGVQRALTGYLAGIIEDNEYSRIAWHLNEDEDSPFKGRITRTSTKKHHLFALHSVMKHIERQFKHGKLELIDEEDKIDYLAHYWTIIADERFNEWSDIELLDDPGAKGKKGFEFKMLELTGFIAWSIIGKEIFSRSYDEITGMNWEYVKELVRLCGNQDWRKDGQYAHATGEVGGPIIATEMEKLLPAITIPSEQEGE